MPAFLKTIGARISVLLLAYSLTRLLFYFWNRELFLNDTNLELLEAFAMGLRFDLATILITNSFSFVLWFLPPQITGRRLFQRIDKGLLFLVNFVCLGANISDVEFVKFIGKRTPYDLIFLGEDLQNQALSVFATYWYFLVGVIIFVGAVTFLLPTFKVERKFPLWAEIGGRLLVIAFAVLGIRGGFQLKPLSTMQAYFSDKHELGLLTLNTPFNVIKTVPSGPILKTRYFQNDAEAIERLVKMTSLTRPPLGVARGFNVVEIVIESFGLEYTGVANSYPGYTPFFDSLAKKGYFYKNAFANARRSVDGVPAALCGLPTMMDEPIITSDFASDRIDCLPKILGTHDYSSYFLHGAYNGSMHFDSFSNLAGFQHFVGRNEYPYKNPDDFDHVWGVLDEPMLQYAIDVMDKANKPVFLGLFTLSSHHPYYIPPKYKGKFPKGTLEIHESIGYTDYALKRFFEVAETKPWFNHTIFVLTADHTQKSEHKEYADLLGPNRVPILFYIPGLARDKIPYDPERMVQQIDIQPSLLDLLGIENPERALVGQSVFDLKKPPHAYVFAYPGYWLMDDGGLVNMEHPPTDVRSYSHVHTHDLKARAWGPGDDERLLDLKAMLQYISEGLVHNDLYTWSKKLK